MKSSTDFSQSLPVKGIELNQRESRLEFQAFSKTRLMILKVIAYSKCY